MLNIIILGLFVLGVFSGFKKGFVKVVIDFVGVIIAIFLAFGLYKPMGSLVAKLFSANLAVFLQNAIGFIVTFVLALVALNIVAYLLTQVMKLPVLTIFNKIGGALFGFLKTLILISLILVVIFSMGIEKLNNVIIDSFLGNVLFEMGKGIYGSIKGILPNADELLPKDWNFEFLLDKIPIESLLDN